MLYIITKTKFFESITTSCAAVALRGKGGMKKKLLDFRSKAESQARVHFQLHQLILETSAVTKILRIGFFYLLLAL